MILLRRVVAVAAIVLAVALIAGHLRPDPPATRQITVAARDLPAGHLLTPSDLRTVQVPADLEAFERAADEADLPGRVIATRVDRGEVLSNSRLIARTPGEGLPDGTAPFHVVVSDPRMLDLAGPGQRVRVHRARTGAMLAQDVLVLGVDPPEQAGGGLFPASAGMERGLVLALPPEVIDAALATPEPDGLVPRVHVVPSTGPPASGPAG